MAVWQFNVALVPRGWIDSGGDVADLFGQEGFDPAMAWRQYDDARLEGVLSRVLSRGRSWHPELTSWGNAETDDIQLWRTDKYVESIHVRFDLRKPNMTLFREVVEIARELALVIVVVEARNVVPADTQRLLRAAAESEAALFSVDPASFLLQAKAANARPS